MASSGMPVFPALVPVLFFMGLVALQGAVLQAGAVDTFTCRPAVVRQPEPTSVEEWQVRVGIFPARYNKDTRSTHDLSVMFIF